MPNLWDPPRVATDNISDACYHELAGRVSNPRCVAIGEVGLDFHHTQSSSAISNQKRLLGRMFDLAKARQKPLVIHCREKQEEDYNAAMKMLWEEKMVNHPIHQHCFVGTVPQLGEWAKFLPNCMFGIAAKSLDKPVQKEVIKRISPNRLLLETASPILSTGML